MKWKLVSAFATGAVLASGIVYVAVRPLPVEEVPSSARRLKRNARRHHRPPLPRRCPLLPLHASLRRPASRRLSVKSPRRCRPLFVTKNRR